MKPQLYLSISGLLLLLMSASLLSANSRSLDFTKSRASIVENKRVEKKIWSQPKSHSLMDKTFPIKEWDKHFSSVGSKRAPIAVKDSKDKQIFRTETLDRKEVNFEMSRWNERMSDLHKKAGIEMDDKTELAQKQQLYSSMLQDAQPFRDMAQELSLRDINRYQFRRNRSDDTVPVEQAGSGQ